VEPEPEPELGQAGVWPLRIEGGGLALADIEKNWTPFVHAGTLHPLTSTLAATLALAPILALTITLIHALIHPRPLALTFPLTLPRSPSPPPSPPPTTFPRRAAPLLLATATRRIALWLERRPVRGGAQHVQRLSRDLCDARPGDKGRHALRVTRRRLDARRCTCQGAPLALHPRPSLSLLRPPSLSRAPPHSSLPPPPLLLLHHQARPRLHRLPSIAPSPCNPPPTQDGSHSPALYGTVLYIVDGSPPFRVRSISPKLCISEREIELAISPRCALQYAVGLGIDETHNLALVSLGEMDRVMKVAALPLDRLVALARTHTLHDDGVTDSECVTWSTPLSEP
jgi:hypothetical protein